MPITIATERVSISAADEQATGGASAGIPSVSDDGNLVAFISGATNLVASDNNGKFDIFVKNRSTKAVTLASKASDGTLGNDTSSAPFISGDGTAVFFASNATNLIASDTNAQGDVFKHVLATGVTTRVSTGSSGEEATGGGSLPLGCSSDGTYVLISSDATGGLLAGSWSGKQLFLKNTITGTIILITKKASDGTPSGGTFAAFARISRNGRYIAFSSTATDLPNYPGVAQSNVYLCDTLADTYTVCNKDDAGNLSNALCNVSAVSDDGNLVMFTSTATNLVTGDNNSQRDMFLRNISAGTTIIVNRAADGTLATGTALNGSFGSISSDNKFVFFANNSTNLTPDHTGAIYDVFRKTLADGAIIECSTHTDGTQGTSNMSSPACNAAGNVVAYITASTQLVTGDTNALADTFATQIFGDVTATNVDVDVGVITLRAILKSTTAIGSTDVSASVNKIELNVTLNNATVYREIAGTWYLDDPQTPTTLETVDWYDKETVNPFDKEYP
jgi:hypothetical protein